MLKIWVRRINFALTIKTWTFDRHRSATKQPVTYHQNLVNSIVNYKDNQGTKCIRYNHVETFRSSLFNQCNHHIQNRCQWKLTIVWDHVTPLFSRNLYGNPTPSTSRHGNQFTNNTHVHKRPLSSSYQHHNFQKQVHPLEDYEGYEGYQYYKPYHEYNNNQYGEEEQTIREIKEQRDDYSYEQAHFLEWSQRW